MRSTRWFFSLVMGGVGLVLGACGSSEVAMGCTTQASPEQLAGRPSPYDSIEVRFDSTWVKLCYSRPYANGREVFGALVPWDTLWRTGANEPTILHLNRSAEVAGIPLTPGLYSLYTVPGRETWTLVVNASTSQWGQTRSVPLPDGTIGASAYTTEVAGMEVGRAEVGTREVAHTEQLTASFRDRIDGRFQLHLEWEQTGIVVPVRVTGS